MFFQLLFVFASYIGQTSYFKCIRASRAFEGKNCRLAVVFLAFDVFFMILCAVIASVVFFTIFCCLPILATIAYAMKIGGGASDKDLKSLPKYKFNTNPHADIANPAEDSVSFCDLYPRVFIMIS